MNVHNQEVIQQMPGLLKVYTATNEYGEKKYLHKISEPQKLHLKVDWRVMCLINKGELQNGMQGVVKELKEHQVVVNFDAIGQRTVKTHIFTQYSNKEGKNVAQREQLPLKLCYALTFHKAQSMDFDNVVVHCQGVIVRAISQSGQLSVAISQVRSSAGLTVYGYRNSMCKPQKPVINHFYGKTSLIMKKDVSCCQGAYEFDLNELDNSFRFIAGIDSDNLEGNDSQRYSSFELQQPLFNHADEYPDSQSFILPSYINPCDIMNSLKPMHQITLNQMEGALGVQDFLHSPIFMNGQGKSE